MSWEYIRLGDVCTKIGSGATPKGGATVYIDEGTSFIRSQNIYNLEFSHEGLAHITEDAAKKLNGVAVQKDDVLINITGDSVARTCMVPDGVLPARVNQHVAIVRPDSNRLNPRFLNYYLTSPYMQSLMLGLAVGKGASRNAMTKDMIANFDILCPPIEIQESIVGILSTYDALIENNQRQIKLLEEAAQRLYKEWFVDLRFPGHEKTKITDGVPKGWRRGALADVATFKRGKTITKEQTNPGVVPVVAGGLEPAYFHDTFNTGAPVITVSGSGANAGFTRMYHTKVWASDCSYVDSVATENLAWVYCFLKENNTKIETMQKGAAQPHVYAKDINALEAVIPNDKQMKRFQAIAEPMFARIGTLETQKARLREACNCLLPKLMNGEIEVEK